MQTKRKALPKQGFILTVFIAFGFDLTFQRNDGMINGLMFFDTSLCRFQMFGLQQDRHTAGKFALNSTGRRGDAGLDIILSEQIEQGKTLLIIPEQDIPTDIILCH